MTTRGVRRPIGNSWSVLVNKYKPQQREREQQHKRRKKIPGNLLYTSMRTRVIKILHGRNTSIETHIQIEIASRRIAVSTCVISSQFDQPIDSSWFRQIVFCFSIVACGHGFHFCFYSRGNGLDHFVRHALTMNYFDIHSLWFLYFCFLFSAALFEIAALMRGIRRRIMPISVELWGVYYIKNRRVSFLNTYTASQSRRYEFLTIAAIKNVYQTIILPRKIK